MHSHRQGLSRDDLTLLRPLEGGSQQQPHVLYRFLRGLLGLLLCGILLVPHGMVAQTSPPPPVEMPVYQPPLRGAPGGRVGGGTRGPGNTVPMLSVLTPDHTGQTIQEQPVLYWYLRPITQHPIVITLVIPQQAQPLLEVSLPPPGQPGIHAVRLADHNVRLSPGVLYQWSVALVLDPAQRSQDIVSSGFIERVTPPETLPGQLAQSGAERAPHVYAAAGLWYDALAAITDFITARPDDKTLRQQRATLLEQVQLEDIAHYDRQQP